MKILIWNSQWTEKPFPVFPSRRTTVFPKVIPFTQCFGRVRRLYLWSKHLSWWAQWLSLQQTMRYVGRSPMVAIRRRLFAARCFAGKRGKCALYRILTRSLCVCVRVADMSSGSELCQRGGDEALPQPRERAGGAKTEENRYPLTAWPQSYLPTSVTVKITRSAGFDLVLTIGLFILLISTQNF